MPAKFTKLCSFPAEWEDDIKNIARKKKISLNDLICDAVFDVMKKEIITESEQTEEEKEVDEEPQAETGFRLGGILKAK